jgi:hypothetical protein
MMASMPSKAHTMNLFINFALPHSKMAPNTTSLVNVVAPYANWTLMGLATFVVAHQIVLLQLGSQTSAWF